jgi:beta-carotene 3-hydroxylase
MLLVNIPLLLCSFAAMEGVAWFAHKYLMHGFLWFLHRDHHTRENAGFFERNDLFFLLFATPGILLTYTGSASSSMDPRLWIGIGISLYGLCYLFVHDVFIHQRFKLFKRTSNTYLMALRRAHRIHHKHLGKEDGECFGMLWVSPRFLTHARRLQSQNA